MKKRLWLKLMAAAAAMISLVAHPAAHAQYPDRPLRFVVPFVAGSAPDIMARFYAEKLKEELGQPVVVDNKPGATATIGTDFVAKAPADGYTLLLNANSMFITPWFTPPPYDVLKDFAPLIRTADTPYIVAVRPSLGVQNLAEFIEHARKNPDKVSCGTFGIGSPPHLALEMLNSAAGVKIRHIPYRTFAQTLPDLLSGTLDCSISPPPVPIPYANQGRIRAIAHTGGVSDGVVGLPGLESIGKHYPSAAVVGWQAIYARAGTPAPILARLRAAWRNVIADPKIVEKIRESGFQPLGDSIDAFEAAMRSDHQRFGDIIKKYNIVP